MSADRAEDRVALGLILALILANSVLQKIAIPGTGGVLPLSLLILMLALGAGVALGRLVPSGVAVVGLVTATAILVGVSALTPAPRFSSNALALVLVLLIPYAVSLRPGALSDETPLRLFNSVAFAFALLGVAQFVGQFVVGPGLAFYLDFALPAGLQLEGFNNLNELSYGSGVYKANGVFLLEASFLNQMLSVALLIEILHFRRVRVLAALLAGLVVTYSGTGLLMLAAIAPIYIIQQRRWDLLLGLAALGVVAVIFADALGLKIFLDRAGELSSNQSSAFARFLSIFHLLQDYVFTDPLTALVGRGPGSVTENFNSVGFSAFDPGWGKVMYEYGLVGFAAYFAFLVSRVAAAAGSPYLKAALLLQFAFLGGYVATPPVHIEILALLVWPTPRR